MNTSGSGRTYIRFRSTITTIFKPLATCTSVAPEQEQVYQVPIREPLHSLRSRGSCHETSINFLHHTHRLLLKKGTDGFQVWQEPKDSTSVLVPPDVPSLLLSAMREQSACSFHHLEQSTRPPSGKKLISSETS